MLSGGYTGTIYRGVDYAPTWPNWAPTKLTQFEDSDFYNHAFRGLWSPEGSGGKGRNDLANIGSTSPNGIGFNEVRLYNWGPVRGWNGTKGTGHLAFLKYAGEQGVKVMVPVSNYFLGSEQYSWGNQVPDANYSWTSAPQPIRHALMHFVSSITMPNGRISSNVSSIEINNEFDIGQVKGFGNPSDTAVVQRALWWVVNLQDRILKVEQKYGSSTPIPLTIPVSNADQGNNGSNLSWFQVFANGVDHKGIQEPNGAPDKTFTAPVTGLSKYSWYNQGWFFNSYQTYKFDTGLTQLLQQYDSGGAGGTDWTTKWPGQTFPGVPLMLTELGLDRITAGTEAKQVDTVANQQVQVMLNYLNSPGDHNIRGFDVFEYNDEPNKNGTTNPTVFHDAVYGIYKYYPTADYNINDFRMGTVQATLQTDKSDLNYSPLNNGDNFFASTDYPVYQLNPVNDNGTTLASLLKKKLRGS
jgi:hypothetical protein